VYTWGDSIKPVVSRKDPLNLFVFGFQTPLLSGEHSAAFAL